MDNEEKKRGTQITLITVTASTERKKGALDGE